MLGHKVFLVGGTGETGKRILNALIEDASFDITCFIRTSSQSKPTTQQLRDRGVKIVTGELNGPIKGMVSLLRGVDMVISCVAPRSLRDQIPLIEAAAQAQVKRFLPCNWSTPSARGGILASKDVKEEVHDHLFQHKLGFTIIDIGFRYQASMPRAPSGKFDDDIFMPINEVFAGGSTPNMLMDSRDAGRITVEIIKDERTLNKRVIAYGEVLSQNEIHTIVEDKTGEKLELTVKTNDEARAVLRVCKEAFEAHPQEKANGFLLASAQYAVSKYVRGDNTPENARYLGYISAHELFPDFKYTSFGDFVDELIAGKIERPYPHIKM